VGAGSGTVQDCRTPDARPEIETAPVPVLEGPSPLGREHEPWLTGSFIRLLDSFVSSGENRARRWFFRVVVRDVLQLLRSVTSWNCFTERFESGGEEDELP
jgi:hypothetical protein